MRAEIRIVAGSLRGRKVSCVVHPGLRPTPQMVREALFSILGNAVPGRPFVDIFAGTGVIGLEAISRGASSVLFVERDMRQAHDIERHLRNFGVADKGQVLRTDAYRWAGYWHTPREPATVYVSPPFGDLQEREQDFLGLVGHLRRKLAPGSVLVLQAEKHTLLDSLPDLDEWDQRTYGRNVLLFWVKDEPAAAVPPPENPE